MFNIILYWTFGRCKIYKITSPFPSESFSIRDVLCSYATKMQRINDNKEAIHSTHLFPYKKHILAESVSISAKLCVQRNMISGNASKAYLWGKNL